MSLEVEARSSRGKKCIDRKTGELVYKYEAGLSSDEEAREIERHLALLSLLPEIAEAFVDASVIIQDLRECTTRRPEREGAVGKTPLVVRLKTLFLA